MQFFPTPLGEALVFAFKEMGLDAFWQPYQRAATERQGAAIASGAAQRGAVVAAAVADYEANFGRVLPQQAVLERALSHFFTRVAGAPEGPGGGMGGGGGAGGVTQCPRCRQMARGPNGLCSCCGRITPVRG